MRYLHVIAAFAPLVFCSLQPFSPAQGTLMDTSAARQKVPGDNPAYYTREREADQLFETMEFIVSPSPPLTHTNNRVFFYLHGAIMKDYPGLANSTLTLRSKFQGDEYEFRQKLSDVGLLTVRKEGVYGGPLKIGGNELVGDQEIMHWRGRKTLQVYIEAVARLPDERVLFAFEADVELNI